MLSVDTIAYQILTRSGTALFDLVGDRVYFGVAPKGFANSRPAIVFAPEDGESNIWNPVQERNYRFDCWGGDAASASWSGSEAVYRALRAAWHGVGRIAVAEGVLMAGWEEMPGMPMTHPETKQMYYECRMAGKFRGA